MSSLISLFKQEYQSTKKALGQHFLTNRHFVSEIADACELAAGDALIEIGPGCGVLTEELYKRSSNITAIDLDTNAYEFLNKYKLDFFPELNVVFGDAAQIEFTDIYNEFTIAGNLPYNVSVKLFEHCTKYANVMKCAVFMFQKEVAARINAEPCSRDYSSLSVFAHYYYNIDKIRDIGGGNFWPNAGVTSTVLRFRPKKDFAFADPSDFFTLVRASFAGKRKTLRNNLRSFPQLPELLDTLGLSPSVRAEELPLEKFVQIYKALKC